LALHRALRDAVRAGQLAPGQRLPTVRDLAWKLGATPGTVSRAYQMATQEGLLAATVGRGTFVSTTTPRLGPTQALFADRDPVGMTNLVDLRSPQLPDVGQSAAFGAVMHRMPESMSADCVNYPSQRAEGPLRAAICGWLEDRVLGPVSADDIALCHGGQNAINLIFMCCLRGDRPAILCEDLAYPGFRHAARLSRAEVVGVEMDQHGIIPDALEAACRRHNPQILCLTPEAQNPTAARMPEARRAQIAAIARAHDLQIIEDDCYSIAQSGWPAIRALAPERTWYVGSFSKSISAALRFGYIACPLGMGHTMRLTAQHSFFAMAQPISDLCLDLLTSGVAYDLRRKVQAEFTDRLQMIVNALGAHDLVWQPGLPFVWLRLPSGWRVSTFARMAEAEGVLVRSADEYALVHGRSPNAMRLAIAGGIPRARLAGALDRLALLLARPLQELAV